jgi:hypothetical protein
MRKLIPFAVLAILLVVAGVALAGSAKHVYTYRSAMTTGAEVPKPKEAAGAKGAFTATVTESGSTRTIKWKLTFSKLSGKAIAAHIHKGKRGFAGAVMIPLCGPCRNGQTGQTKISKDAADLLESGRTYVNVHTTKNLAGEIRGQVTLTGEDGAGAGGSTGSQTTSPTVTDPMPDPGYSPPPGYGY